MSLVTETYTQCGVCGHDIGRWMIGGTHRIYQDPVCDDCCHALRAIEDDL